MRIFPLTAAIFLAASPAFAVDDPTGYFDTYIRPILTEHCYECHSHEAKKSKGGLVLDSKQSILGGGDSGPAAVLGKPDESLLVEAIQYDHPDYEMPPDGKLPDSVVKQLREWVERGLPHANEGARTVAKGPDYQKLIDEHWAFQPVQRPNDATIDSLVRAKLKEQGLEQVSQAEPLTLLRRLSFDLVGLPPTVEQIESIEKNPSPQNFQRIIDNLLGSDQFGVRWGRHWLDVARFAESNGKSRDTLFPHAWRYRNYVFDAFAEDMPYDQFISEQVAGDLLPAQSPAERDRKVTATGFLAIGAKTQTSGGDQFTMDMVDDQLDTLGKATLGLAIGCARCHDHKFDPIPTEDYYAMAGMFTSTETLFGRGLKNKNNPEYKLLTVLGPDHEKVTQELAAHHKKIDDLEKEQKKQAKKVADLKKKLPKDWQKRAKALKDESNRKNLSEEDQQVIAFQEAQKRDKELQDEIKQLKKKKFPDVKYAMSVQDSRNIGPENVRVGGEPGDKGDQVDRGFLSCVKVTDVPEIPEKASGRRQLAQWLTSPENPLTPRVAVNRIWLHLFGRGLVNTPDNFGVNGQAPSHPELLDYLAARFMELGWSHKKLIREIVTSDVYQLSSQAHEKSYAADPDNRFLWRMNRRRLEAEPLRDALLAAGGNLKLERPEFGSPVAQIGNGEVGRGIDQKPLEAPFPYRAAYLPILRTKMNDYLKLFDFPEPSNTQTLRGESNVPAQALWFMNNPFVIEQAKSLYERVKKQAEIEPKRVDLAYQISLGRPATKTEIDRALNFTGGDPERWVTFTQSLLASAEFRYVN